MLDGGPAVEFDSSFYEAKLPLLISAFFVKACVNGLLDLWHGFLLNKSQSFVNIKNINYDSKIIICNNIRRNKR